MVQPTLLVYRGNLGVGSLQGTMHELLFADLISTHEHLGANNMVLILPAHPNICLIQLRCRTVLCKIWNDYGVTIFLKEGKRC